MVILVLAIPKLQGKYLSQNISINFSMSPPFNILLKTCTQARRRSSSVTKVGVVGVGVRVSRCLKEELGYLKQS